MHVDVVVGPAAVGQPEIVEPANRLPLGRPLVTHPYRLYPVTDQIADKVCATMGSYGQDRLASSRVKDLVDLVVLARTQKVDLDQLRLAIATKAALSQLAPFERALAPAGGQSAVWVPGAGWTSPGDVVAAEAAVKAEVAAGGDVYVRHHTRAGWPVREHWRAARGI